MTARTNLDQGLIERKLREKRRKRQAILLAVVGLICFYLMRLITLDRATTAEQHGEQSMYQNSTTKVSKANAEVEDARPKGKIVYLTFDDGPSDLTAKFLDVLRQHGVKANFFMQGIKLQRKNLQSDVKRAVREGHYVGGHSMTHQYKKLYEEGQFVSEMKDSLALIHDITGENPHLVRPPYGSVPGLNDKKLRDQIATEGMKIWDWTIDSNDWELKDHPEQIVENIKKATKVDLEVVLMHEKPQTLQALPEIIEFYQEEGYQFGVYDDNEHFHLNFQKDHRL
ncbi:polysaccharide deacetylase [Paenibacillus sp. N3/727]|uniref:polysaccharide deacetylase family protein n=1 Tax=Paenibacillus sp. N3/727 TaxID=2925845 RepID=UPI001F533806|nr:polysaccharide deacetylase family protein [Paenibacillus sp. N3/727]UNK15784.1 polysaccharide deacetylase [Paenibacillus sp. N3/727]